MRRRALLKAGAAGSAALAAPAVLRAQPRYKAEYKTYCETSDAC